MSATAERQARIDAGTPSESARPRPRRRRREHAEVAAVPEAGVIEVGLPGGGMVAERHGAEDVGDEALLCIWLLESLLPGGGGEVEDAALGPGREETEKVAEVGPGFDAVELAAGQEGDEDRVDAGALVAAEKEPVPPAEDLAAEVSLGDIVVCALAKAHSLPGENPGRSTVAPTGSTWSGSGGNK